MGRNLYILAATLGTLALLSIGLSFAHIGEVPGTPSYSSLWRTTGAALLAVALIIALAGVLSSLFEQAERRAEQQREQARRNRRP
jgi:membrane protein implicated in regulation of membrane protease activity